MPSSEGPKNSQTDFYYSRLERSPFPGYFVRRAFIKITNIDFGRAMKNVMTLRSACVSGPGVTISQHRGRRNTFAVDFNSPVFPSKFHYLQSELQPAAWAVYKKNKIFRLLSGKDWPDISPLSTPTWKCLFQPPDIYNPALLPLPSILIFWSCQDLG